jgi:hypothetical protein
MARHAGDSIISRVSHTQVESSGGLFARFADVVLFLLLLMLGVLLQARFDCAVECRKLLLDHVASNAAPLHGFALLLKM